MSRRREEELPAGYEYVMAGDYKRLAVPQAAAKAWKLMLAEQEVQKARELFEKRHSAAQVADVGMPHGGSRDHDSGCPEEAPAGSYRVLPRFDEQVGPDAFRDFKARVPDHDLQERIRQLHERLRSLGPDRLVGRPTDWAKALDGLEEALPNFRQPIGLLRKTLGLAEAVTTAVRVPPMLLFGPPGLGKTYFSHRVAELLGVPHSTVAFDQPSAGSQLRGSDKHWSTSQAGILFTLICMGEFANPVVLLDEVDKATAASTRFDVDPLAQLHGALEPQTARRLVDTSTDIEFDASLTTYVATANTWNGIGLPLLSRFEVFSIAPPEPGEAVQIARHVCEDALRRLALTGQVKFERKGLYVLARLSPRLMQRTAEKAIAVALRERRTEVAESDIWGELEMPGERRWH